MGHLRTLKESKWTFFTWKPACSLSRLLIEAWEAWSYFTVDSQSNICWASGQPERDSGPIVNSPTWSSVSWSSIKLTQINCLFLLDKSTEWLASHYHSDSRHGAVGFSWLAMMALHQEQEEAQGNAQGHEGMESFFSIHPAPSAPLRGQCGQPLLVQTYDLVQDAKVSTPVTMHVKGLTPPLWQQVLELHMSISVTSKKVFLTQFFPPLPEICKPENAVLISLPGRNMIRD